MNKISKDTIDEILAVSKNEEVIGEFFDLHKTGKAFYTKCPICGKEGKSKGLIVTPGEKIYKCFSCQWGGNNPIKFLIEAKKMSYIESLQYLALKYNITIQEDKKEPQKKSGKPEKSYRDSQLEASGLNNLDQKAWVQQQEDVKKDEKNSGIKEVNTFESGTLNEFGQIVEGNDIIIWYYDLYGNPVTYKKPKHTKLEPLFRIRWQNPELHCDKNGRPMKYKSPYGSGSHLFIPEQIRKAFQERRTIKRLYIQEGEKKALKACKHGMLSVGVMGIQNIGMNKELPYAFELIIRTCNVEEVIFVLDADWDHLSNNIHNGIRADLRPLGFFSAIRNYKEYFKAFINGGLYLEIYFAHIIENKNNDKGIDDLLTNTLNENENDLFNDIESAINEKSGEGKHIQFFKISTMPDLRLREIWCLDSVEHFTAKYKEKLIGLKEFQFGHVKWCFNEKGSVVPSQPLQEDEQYWDKEVWETKAGFSRVNMRFRYLYAYTFLNRRGFGKIKMLDGKEVFVRVIDKVVHIIDSHDAKDYIYSFTMDIVSFRFDDINQPTYYC